MKKIYSGLEGQGKSYMLAMQAWRILLRNAKWKKQHSIIRPIVSNMTFSEFFLEKATSLGVPVIYWQDLDFLIKHEDCDVIIDEVGNYFDSRGWESLSLDVRRWLSQGSKRGVDIYGSAQDFAQIDVAFRRLTNELLSVRKLLGSRRPSPVRKHIKFLWGVFLVRSLDPHDYDEKKFKPVSIFPSIEFLIRKYTRVFDTNEKIVLSKPPVFKHVTRYCEECGYTHTKHI